MVSVLRPLSPRRLPLRSARLLALVLLVVAPWCYGGTTPGALRGLTLALLALSGLALVGWGCEKRLPRLDWTGWVGIGLLALGWLSTLLPRAEFDELTKLLFPIEGARWPGTVDAARSLPVMLRLTGLAGLFFLLFDLATEPRWRKRLWLTLAVSGGGVALHGLVQQVEGDIWGYWQGRRLPFTVFAGFWYHGNAAAFLNLTWPFAVALALKSFRSPGAQVARAGWTFVSLLLLAAALVNVSKAGHLLLLLQMALLGLFLLPPFLRTWQAESGRQRRPYAALLLVVAGLGLALVFGLDGMKSRWSELTLERLRGESRLESARFCLRELPAAGWLGRGPGTFEAVFLDAGTRDPERVPRGRWRYAHQDSLQTLVEWGWLGGGLWLGTAAALWGRTWRQLRRLRRPLFSRRHALQAAAFTSLTGLLLHAQMDFPLQILSVQMAALAVIALGAVRARDDASQAPRASSLP